MQVAKPQGYKLSSGLDNFLSHLKDLQSMVKVLKEGGNDSEASVMQSQAVDYFLQIMSKESTVETNPPHVITAINILEKGRSFLLVEDLIEFMEIFPFMYEPLMREIYIHVILGLENISARYSYSVYS